MPALPVESHDDVAAFFDGTAASYSEQHGDAERLLRYRLDLLRSAAGLLPQDEVLEIGCGNGLHLLALAPEIDRGIGLDLSPGMIEAARRRAVEWHEESHDTERISFTVGAAETLAPIDDQSVDVVLCVGSLEHMLDRAAVFKSAFRVLRPGGRLACLTLNGGSFWYRWLAPLCGIETRQLQTDRYLTHRELKQLVSAAGFGNIGIEGWTFVQRGDMPGFFASICDQLDRLGENTGLESLRGGLRVSAHKPRN